MNRQSRRALSLAALAPGICLLAFRQTPPLAFAVASIKPTAQASGGVEGGCHGIDAKFAPDDPAANVPLGRCVITAGRLSHLMRIAYAMPADRMQGFPDWDGPSRFDFEAEAPDPATATQTQLLAMLQNLLVQRFQLVLRHDTAQAPVFNLVVGKNGPKLHASALDARSGPQFQGADLVFRGYSMAELAAFLSDLPSIGRPVRDHTGLAGRFDFTLDLMQNQPTGPADQKMALATSPTAVSDVQDQLGLKFVPTTGTVEFLTITHATRPTPNN